MSQDKGQLRYGGQAQVQRAAGLLASLDLLANISIRPDQAEMDCYRGLPLVQDQGQIHGPAAGLLAQWALQPENALMVLAVDMPLVDRALLQELLSARNREKLATAFTHAEGTIEPLCTIWEPKAGPQLLAAAERGNPSLRRLLEASEVELCQPSNSKKLISVNTPEEYQRVKRILG